LSFYRSHAHLDLHSFPTRRSSDLNGAPDAYGKLSAFATRNTTNVWGARAALALGYQDFSKNRMAQALGWLLKSQGDALCGSSKRDRKSTRLNSSHLVISYAVFCLK